MIKYLFIIIILLNKSYLFSQQNKYSYEIQTDGLFYFKESLENDALAQIYKYKPGIGMYFRVNYQVKPKLILGVKTGIKYFAVKPQTIRLRDNDTYKRTGYLYKIPLSFECTYFRDYSKITTFFLGGVSINRTTIGKNDKMNTFKNKSDSEYTFSLNSGMGFKYRITNKLYFYISANLELEIWDNENFVYKFNQKHGFNAYWQEDPVTKKTYTIDKTNFYIYFNPSLVYAF